MEWGLGTDGIRGICSGAANGRGGGATTDGLAEFSTADDGPACGPRFLVRLVLHTEACLSESSGEMLHFVLCGLQLESKHRPIYQDELCTIGLASRNMWIHFVRTEIVPWSSRPRHAVMSESSSSFLLFIYPENIPDCVCWACHSWRVRVSAVFFCCLSSSRYCTCSACSSICHSSALPLSVVRMWDLQFTFQVDCPLAIFSFNLHFTSLNIFCAKWQYASTASPTLLNSWFSILRSLFLASRRAIRSWASLSSWLVLVEQQDEQQDETDGVEVQLKEEWGVECWLSRREQWSTGCSTITWSLPPSTAQDNYANDDEAELKVWMLDKSEKTR